MLVDFPHLKSQIVVHETYLSYKPMKKVYLSLPAHEECCSCCTLRTWLAPQGTGFHDVPIVKIVERIQYTKLRKRHTYYVPPHASVMMFSRVETCESLERRSLFNLSTSNLKLLTQILSQMVRRASSLRNCSLREFRLAQVSASIQVFWTSRCAVIQRETKIIRARHRPRCNTNV